MPVLGARGVEFFFLLSGFLIGKKYFATERLDTLRYSAKYAISKGKTIYPMYILTMLPMLALLVKEWADYEIGTYKLLSILGAKLLYLQSWIPSEDFYYALNGATWFLSDLLSCYLMTFIFIWSLRKVDARVTLVMIFLVEFLWELIILKQLPDQTTFLVYVFPMCRVLDYGIGICMGVVANQWEGKKMNLDVWLLVVLTIYIISIILFDTQLMHSFYHVIEAALIWNVIMNSGKIGKILFENTAIVKIGDISEIIFLTHLPVISYMQIIWGKLVGNRYRFIEWCFILICITFTAYVVNNIQKNIYMRHRYKE